MNFKTDWFFFGSIIIMKLIEMANAPKTYKQFDSLIWRKLSDLKIKCVSFNILLEIFLREKTQGCYIYWVNINENIRHINSNFAKTYCKYFPYEVS